MRTRSLCLPLVLTAITFSACSNSTPSSTVVVGTDQVIALDFADTVAWEGSIFWVTANTFDPFVKGVTVIGADSAAAAAAKGIGAFYSPPGCVSTATSAGRLTLRFGTCDGPFEVNNTTGAVALLFTPVSNGVQIAASSSTVKSTRGNLSLDATALYTENGDSRSLAVTSMSSGTGVGGTPTARQGQYTLTWTKGSDCATIDGEVASAPNGADRNTFGAYQVCRTGCPRSGTVTRQDPQTGITITTTYNGTATVSFTTSDGRQGTTTLSCQ